MRALRTTILLLCMASVASSTSMLTVFTGGKILVIRTPQTATMTSSVDDLLSATPTGSYKPIFSTIPPAGGADDPPFASTPVYNTACWGYSLRSRLCGIAWYDADSNGNLGRAVAINRRMVITSEHGTHGGPITWILTDGSTVTRTLASMVTEVGGAGANGFRVFMLDSELPSSVPITPMMHPSYTTSMNGKPVCRLDGNATFGLLVAIMGDWTFNQFTLAAPESATRLNYYEAAISGDSGSCVFAIYGETLIYLGNITQNITSAAGHGPNAHNRASYIQTAVNTLNTAYGTDYEITYITPEE